ncbi:MAG: P-loop NTPase [Pseudomonadota bacterium]
MKLNNRHLLKRSLYDVTSVKPEDLRSSPEVSSSQKFPKISAKVSPANAQVICIASGKGGTGKTVVTTNLAILMAKAGRKVLLFDADLGLANAHLLLGISPTHDISQLLSGEKKIDDIMVTDPHGVQLISGGSGFSELAELNDWRFRYLARQFRELEKKFDLIFVDLSAGISPQVMRFLSVSHEIILVTNPDITALIDAYATIKSLTKFHRKVCIKLLINKVRKDEELESAHKKLVSIVNKHLKSVELSLLGWLPQNFYIQNSVVKRMPVVSLHPKSFVTRQFCEMAKSIGEQHLNWKRRQANSSNPDVSFFASLEQMVFE